MKINIRRSDERGTGELDWLKSQHTFSFAEYYDAEHMGFHSLRVINEDVVAPGHGFGAHPHKNMEIVTFMIEGELEHQDNRGNKALIKKGEVQRMTAGRGIIHSEINASKTEPAHLLQIWILPEEQGLEPGYVQRSFAEGLSAEGLTLLVSPDGANNSLTINQDAKISFGGFAKGKGTKLDVSADRALWIQVVSGDLTINKDKLRNGDALSLEGGGVLDISANEKSSFILFDLKSDTVSA